MLSMHMVGANIYKRELYLNINHFQGHAEQQKSQARPNNTGDNINKAPGTKDDHSLGINPFSKNILEINFDMQDKDVNKKKSIKSASRIVKNLIIPQIQERPSGNKEHSADLALDRIQQMNLIPLGVAMHHLLQSPVMDDLFNTLKRQCLDQIGLAIRSIEKEIGTFQQQQ